MNAFEIFGVASSGLAVAFFFGKQSRDISTLKKNVNDIGTLHRETIVGLAQINVQLARIDQRLLSLER